MTTEVFEGTLTEVQEMLRRLPLAPEQRVRAILEAMETPCTSQCVDNGPPPPLAVEETNAWAEVAARLANAPRHNGIILAPLTDPQRILTTEMVKELVENE